MARETQDNRIARTAAEVWETTAKEAGELAFVSKVLVQAFLPHSDPGVPGWVRKNGNFTLTLKSGVDVLPDGNFSPVGLPYGSIPRLLLAWLNSEAIKNAQNEALDNPKIVSLGRSLSEFLDKIGVDKSGGKKGGITRFKKQAEKLFRAEITVTSTGAELITERDMKIADGRFLFWSHQYPEQPGLWESAIELSDRFYSLLVRNPVPLDWRILKAIKQSPMALDLYMWLTHRMSYLEKPVNIQWHTLQQQLGADIERIDHFRDKVRKQLVKISTVWKELKVDTDDSKVITLYPTPLLISGKSENKKTRLFKESKNG